MRSHALLSSTPQTLYICVSPWMCSEMNPWILSLPNDSRQFITDVSILALAIAFNLPLQLLIGDIAGSRKWI